MFDISSDKIYTLYYLPHFEANLVLFQLWLTLMKSAILTNIMIIIQ